MGCYNVDAMLEDMSSQQFSEWVAFYRLEPFGPEWDRYGDALVASTLMNVNRAKDAQVVKPERLMPGQPSWSGAQKQTAEQMGEFLRALAGDDS